MTSNAELQTWLVKREAQGNVARMFFLRFTSASNALAWLREQEIPYGDESPQPALGIAFTSAGLRALGLTDRQLAGFSPAFREGMAARKKQTGPEAWASTQPDIQPCPSDRWCPKCRNLTEVHAVVIKYVAGKDDQAVKATLAHEGEWSRQTTHGKNPKPPELWDGRAAPSLTLNDGVEIIGWQDLHRPLVTEGDKTYGVDYFGFGVRSEASPPPLVPVLKSSDPLVQGGAYLVVRQMEQDVAEFRKTLMRTKEEAPVEAAELFVGRKRDGTALSKCPFASHVGRMAPPERTRTQSTDRKPELVRRGMSYADAHGGRGLMFMAFNRDFEQDFEFIQRNWVQRGDRVGMTTSDRDPIAGISPSQASRPSGFLHEGSPSVVASLGDHVKLWWGDYFFVPSKFALSVLVGEAYHRPPSPGTQLEGLEGEAARTLIGGWLDDVPDALRFWEFVTSEGGYRVDAFQPAWVFVADPEAVQAVLGNDGTSYSVSEYARRMRTATGDFFLGMDKKDPAHARESSTRAIIPAYGNGSDAVADAIRLRNQTELIAKGLLQAALERAAPGNSGSPVRLSLNALIAPLLSQTMGAEFGIPGPNAAALAKWGQAIASYYFRVAADEIDAAKAVQAGATYRTYVAKRVNEVRSATAQAGDQLTNVIAEMESLLAADTSADVLVRNLIGVVSGGLGATMALFLTGLCLYASENSGDGKLNWPTNAEGDEYFLFTQVVEKTTTKAKRGAPDHLYRQYVGNEPKQLGNVTVKQGELVVVWLGGALGKDQTNANEPSMLFGTGFHACPGWRMGRSIIDGLLRALAAAKPGRLVLLSGEYHYEFI